MNILFIVDSLSGGGAEKVTSILANQMCKNADDNIYLLVDERFDNEYPLDSRVNLLSIDRKHYKTAIRNIIQKIRKYAIIKRIKRKYKIQCSIGMLPIACFYNVITRTGSEKIINSIRIKLSASEYPRYLLKMIKYSMKKADMVVAVSNCVRKDAIRILKINEEKIVTVFNPCDIDRINQLKGEDINGKLKNAISQWDFAFATHGRLSLQKGQWHLFRVIKSLRDKGYNVGLFVLGAGELENRLKDLIGKKDLNECVILLGYDTNPYKYLMRADMYLFGSIYEGFPNALLDAMASGLPIISSDGESGIRELLAPDTDCEYETNCVEEAKYGILVPRFTYEFSDDYLLDEGETAMETVIIKMIDHPELRDHYRKMSFERLQDYTFANIVREWYDVIK